MGSALVKEPMYQQLNGHLRVLVKSGECAVGSKFLTERQICERYGVSRATANKALSNLVSEGLLEFRKGIGTFVQGRALDYNLRALVSFTDKAISAGKQPSTQVLQFANVAVKDVLDEVPDILEARAEDSLFYMERLRLANSRPVILERRYVVAKYCPGLTEKDAAGSIYAVWLQRYQLPIEFADESIRAVNIRGSDARALQVRDGEAGMLVTSVGYLTVRRPLWYERTLYRGAAYEFQNRLTGIQSESIAAGKFLDIGEGPI
jgi:GntR family transcriptional regulator